MHKNKLGFTLIELLIVIAIIGILAGAVVVSLGDTTEAAQDATDKATLTSLRPLTILHIAGNSGLSAGMCANDEISGAITKLNTKRGSPATVFCNDEVDDGDDGTSKDDWVIYMHLLGDIDNAFCMDANGSESAVARTNLSNSGSNKTTECPTS